MEFHHGTTAYSTLVTNVQYSNSCVDIHRLPEALKTTVDSQVQSMLQNDIIQPSHSPWSSPIVMVEKKDGT